VSSAILTSMELDFDYGIGFFGDAVGRIHLFDLKSDPPMSKQSISVSKGSRLLSISAWLDDNKVIIASAESGDVGVYHFEDPKNVVNTPSSYL